MSKIFLALILRDADHILHTFLEKIKELSYPKNRIHIYILTDNNTDNTLSILEKWKEFHEKLYSKIELVSEIPVEIKYEEPIKGDEKWNEKKLIKICKIRNYVLDRFLETDCTHYFSCDVDCFIKNNTLTNLLNANLEWVAPLIVGKPHHYQTSFFAETTESGYWKHSQYNRIFTDRTIKGLLHVGLIHCVFLITREALLKGPRYNENGEYDFIGFNRNCKLCGIQAHLDNREVYGFTFSRIGFGFTREIEKGIVKSNLSSLK